MHMKDFGFYLHLGWEHIMTPDALDHILFVAALSAIYVLRDWKQVLILITAFTIGHATTLVLATKQWVMVNSSWVEFLVALTIVVTAISNLFQKNFTHRTIRINYGLALFFGLIHGLAFANILREILAADQNFTASLFAFSLGLELGQILVVLLVLVLAFIALNLLRVQRRDWVLFVSAAVFSLALQMALERRPKREAPKENFEVHYSQTLNTQYT